MGGGFATSLFDAQDSCYGEVLLMPQTADTTHLSHALFRKQIRFLSFSASSDRCSPLLVLLAASGATYHRLPGHVQACSL